VVTYCDRGRGLRFYLRQRGRGLPLVRCSIQAVGFRLQVVGRATSIAKQAAGFRLQAVGRANSIGLRRLRPSDRSTLFPYNAQVAFSKGPILEDFWSGESRENSFYRGGRSPAEPQPKNGNRRGRRVTKRTRRKTGTELCQKNKPLRVCYAG
jgi:hypothetical protein